MKPLCPDVRLLTLLLLLNSPDAGTVPDCRAAPSQTLSNPAELSEFVSIPVGTFGMGSTPEEAGRRPDESVRRIAITRQFEMARVEVHWTLWSKVRRWGLENGYLDLVPGNNGFAAKGNEDHPVTSISWWDAVKWCNARSEMERLTPVYRRKGGRGPDSVIRTGMPAIEFDGTADGYRLPTEAEWEYACRAGSSTALSSGALAYAKNGKEHDANADAAGWYNFNSDRNTHPGAGKRANVWGLYDMHGNVAEWCWDWYGPYLDQGEARNANGPTEGVSRIIRGGSWMSPPRQLRSAARHALAPATVFYSIGFRLARTR